MEVIKQTWYGSLLILVKFEDSLRLYRRIEQNQEMLDNNTGFYCLNWTIWAFATCGIKRKVFINYTDCSIYSKISVSLVVFLGLAR